MPKPKLFAAMSSLLAALSLESGVQRVQGLGKRSIELGNERSLPGDPDQTVARHAGPDRRVRVLGFDNSIDQERPAVAAEATDQVLNQNCEFGVMGLLKVWLTLRVWWFRPRVRASRWSQTRSGWSCPGLAAGVDGGRCVRSR